VGNWWAGVSTATSRPVAVRPSTSIPSPSTGTGTGVSPQWVSSSRSPRPRVLHRDGGVTAVAEGLREQRQGLGDPGDHQDGVGSGAHAPGPG